MIKQSATVMVFTQNNLSLKKEELKLTPVGENEILVQVTYTTICTSDLHTYTGRRISPSPCVLGHEIIGFIQDLGKNIQTDYNGNHLKVGDRITWSVYAYDREDDMAKKGIPQKSEGLYKYGHHEFTLTDGLNGGFGSHCLLRSGTAVFKLAETISAKEAAPINCTHATIAGALRVAGAIKDKNVLITGAGMLGLSACAMTAHGGAKKVYALDIDHGRLTFAEKFGATRTFDGGLPASELKKILAADKPDVVIDTTGVPAVMEKGLELLAIGGTAVWVGAVYNQPKTQINAEMVVRNLLNIKGLHNYTPGDLASALDFVEKNSLKFPFESLVGDEYPLEDLEAAFESAGSGNHYRVGIHQ